MYPPDPAAHLSAKSAAAPSLRSRRHLSPLEQIPGPPSQPPCQRLRTPVRYLRPNCSLLAAAALLLASSLLLAARADDPYRFYTWNVTFGDIYPLGVKQQVRLA